MPPREPRNPLRPAYASRVSAFENPALAAFIAEIHGERVVAQVLIRRDGMTFELRHVADRDAAASSLVTTLPAKARELAQFTADGAFRPLKSAPTLKRGWRIVAPGTGALGLALDGLLPGAVADWFAARREPAPVTPWQDMTARQSGMYRITTMLDADGVVALVAATCASSRCLKRRLWTATSVGPEPATDKTIIPCLEPCAIILEAARCAVRAEEQEGGRQAEG